MKYVRVEEENEQCILGIRSIDAQVEAEQERQKVYKYTEMLYSLVMKSAGRIKRVYLKIVL